jgi:hypothetical protein
LRNRAAPSPRERFLSAARTRFSYVVLIEMTLCRYDVKATQRHAGKTIPDRPRRLLA